MSTPLNGSILKGFEILSLFSEDRREISTGTVVDNFQMNNGTAHRLLMTLEQAGAIRSIKRGVFALGSEIERLGLLAEQGNAMASIVQPKLDVLCNRVGESVMACRLSRHGPTCIAVTNSRQAISVNIKVGTLLPLHRTAQGKLWMAEMAPEERERRLAVMALAGTGADDPNGLDEELQQIRRQGYALNLGSNEPDIAAISMPARNMAGEMKLSVSVFGMLSRFDEDFVEEAKIRLAETVRKIEPTL